MGFQFACADACRQHTRSGSHGLALHALALHLGAHFYARLCGHPDLLFDLALPTQQRDGGLDNARTVAAAYFRHSLS